MLKWESLRAETITGHSQYAAAAHFPPYAPSPAGPAHSGRRKGKSAFLRPFPFCHAGAGRRSRAARQIFRFAARQAKERELQSALALDDAFLLFRALSRRRRGLGRHCRRANAGPVLSAAAVKCRCLQRLRRAKPLGRSGPACYACAAAARRGFAPSPARCSSTVPHKSAPCDTIFTHWASQCMDEESSNVALR